MNQQEDYKAELEQDIKTEKKLWIKELVVFFIIFILIVIREVFLREWFIFTN